MHAAWEEARKLQGPKPSVAAATALKKGANIRHGSGSFTSTGKLTCDLTDDIDETIVFDEPPMRRILLPEHRKTVEHKRSSTMADFVKELAAMNASIVIIQQQLATLAAKSRTYDDPVEVTIEPGMSTDEEQIMS